MLLSYIQAVCAFVAPRQAGASTAIIDRLSHSRAHSVDEAQVQEILREVFPNLTDEELNEYAARLELKAVLALEVELSGIRDVADGLRKGSPS